MTHDELLADIDTKILLSEHIIYPIYMQALRAVVELAVKQLDTTNMPAEQVGWFNEGYNLAMDNVIEAIERELV